MKQLVWLPILLILVFSIATPVWGKKKAKEKDEIAFRNKMVVISRQLGVVCAECHDLKNFRSNKKKNKKNAKLHMEIVEHINKKYGKRLKAPTDCYVCHKGKLVPDYKEKVGVTD